MKTSAVIDSTAESEEETEQEQIFASIHIHTAQWRLKTPPERFVDNVCHHNVVTSRSSTNKNHLKTKASLALACTCTCRHTCVTEDGVGDDLWEEVSPVEENWTELQWWHCQRSSIDSLGMMVYSGQILETKLCTKLNFSVLLFIVESLKAGVCFKLQKAINYNVYDHYLYIVSCILLFSYTYSSNNVFNSHYYSYLSSRFWFQIVLLFIFCLIISCELVSMLMLAFSPSFTDSGCRLLQHKIIFSVRVC